MTEDFISTIEELAAEILRVAVAVMFVAIVFSPMILWLLGIIAPVGEAGEAGIVLVQGVMFLTAVTVVVVRQRSRFARTRDSADIERRDAWVDIGSRSRQSR